ncbi:hypothetical protein ODJ79_45960 [Actinoplanes sp. KI2]|uniref:hypothetical protein n=1 Tax=Actinoplanes sp. KI2 TaxID=2983315 RepID=UPI0021D5CA93|nr:hypothetical protein [Actinoplanes sp. KI2]MCU7731105.1 hypothetical protein [Actinoplanes sp. KI2]
MVAAGCANEANATPQPGQSSARTWQSVSAGCPALTSPPYGVASKGKRVADYVAPGERETLDKVVPGAVFDDTSCRYTAPGKVSPLITARIRIFSGAAGAATATTWFESERSASSQIGGADAPGLADGAFAVYFEPALHLDARSGNAYVSVEVLPGMENIRTFDKLHPLQQQLPALTPVMKDLLASLQ